MSQAEAFSDTYKSDSVLKYYQNVLDAYDRHDASHKDILYFTSIRRVAMTYALISEEEKGISVLNQGITDVKASHLNHALWEALFRKDLGQLYFGKNEYPTAKAFLRQAQDTLAAIVGENHAHYAEVLYVLGRVFISTDELDLALENLTQAQRIIEDQQASWSPKAQPLLSLHTGITYNLMGKYDSAQVRLQQALDLSLSLSPDGSPLVGDSYWNQGVMLMDQGEYEQAQIQFEEALNVYLKVSKPTHPQVTATYNYLGQIYWRKGDFDQASAYYLKALDIIKLKYGENHGQVASLYNNLGILQENQDRYAQALEYYFDAVRVREKVNGEMHASMANHLNNIGQAYQRLQDYDKAIEYHTRALKIRLAVQGERHPAVSTVYRALGIVAELKEDLPLAVSYLEQALALQLATFGENHPETILQYERLSEYHRRIGNCTEAIDYAYKSLQSNLLGFEVTPEHPFPPEGAYIRYPDNFITSLNTLAMAYVYCGKEDTVLLKQALKCCERAIAEIELVTRNYRQKGSQLVLIGRNYILYETAIRSLLELASLHPNPAYQEQAFLLAERGKAVLFRQSLQASEAARFSGLPAGVVELEQRLKNQVLTFETRIYEENQKSGGDQPVKIKALRDTLFQLRLQYDSLLTNLEQAHPEYYQLKYATFLPKVADMQQRIPEETTFLEYYVGYNQVYAFLLDNEQLEVKLLEVPADTIRKQIDLFRSQLYAYYLDETEKKWDFRPLSQTLYQELIAPVAKAIHSRLVIIPDGTLGYLPFEVLMDSTEQYLIEKHSISYGRAAYLDLYPREQSRMPLAPVGKLLAFAPKFEEQKRVLSTAEATRSGYFGPLMYNSIEVNEIQDIWGGTILTGSRATQRQFHQLAPRYQVIHLSSHGKVNDQHPEYSFLAFHSPGDTLRIDSFTVPNVSALYLSELYRLNLQAEMVVLSACETGVGKLYQGEGISSLAQGFFYAGAESIITTLWQVNDQSSAQFMQQFYAYLRQGMSKDAALRQVKLNFISEKEDPYYWAPYVALGDMQPLTQDPFRQSHKALWTWGIALLGLGIWLIYLWSFGPFPNS